MSLVPPRLGVNIDHVATLRNIRGGMRPDPVRAALLAIEAGADSITAHLREDRRHIRDEDMVRLKQEISKPLNFEMAPTGEMQKIALHIRPHACCIVPEKREERTTEGGIDVIKHRASLQPLVAELSAAMIRVSLFIEPSMEQVEGALEVGAPVVELHTGAWCDALISRDHIRADELFGQLRVAAAYAAENGIECHAGHGLDFDSAGKIAQLPQIVELNIGHFLMGEALFGGLPAVIARMRAAIREGRESVMQVDA